MNASSVRQKTRKQTAPTANATCRLCGCTETDCRGCIARTGKACHWVEPDLCSACQGAVLILVDVRNHGDAYRAVGRRTAKGTIEARCSCTGGSLHAAYNCAQKLLGWQVPKIELKPCPEYSREGYDAYIAKPMIVEGKEPS
ncbi:hypothetical protein [Prosthecobacter sp.]|uniref:hypothetical protein n=1 Tax=Prosthecobacter sp. TaxID=1965333 RepID=UPI003784637E